MTLCMAEVGTTLVVRVAPALVVLPGGATDTAGISRPWLPDTIWPSKPTVAHTQHSYTECCTVEFAYLHASFARKYANEPTCN